MEENDFDEQHKTNVRGLGSMQTNKISYFQVHIIEVMLVQTYIID